MLAGYLRHRGEREALSVLEPKLGAALTLADATVTLSCLVGAAPQACCH
jgi:hypothetical protein